MAKLILLFELRLYGRICKMCFTFITMQTVLNRLAIGSECGFPNLLKKKLYHCNKHKTFSFTFIVSRDAAICGRGLMHYKSSSRSRQSDLDIFTSAAVSTQKYLHKHGHKHR